jgi:radical SAM-linked protein
MQANYVQRLRLVFSKNGPARYIGHLDLVRTLERALNRARIPIAYTQGFNPRPRLSFAAPLPLGYTSEYELADIWLMEKMAPEAALAQMMDRMAPGIEVTAVEPVPLRAPSLQATTSSADYTAVPFETVNAGDLGMRIERLLAQESLMRERKRGKGKVKRYDLRPLIKTLTLDNTQDGKTMIYMTLMLKTGKSGRPDEVLAALDLDPLAAHIHRTMITLGES